jgi:hypothetical protein
MQNTKKRSGVDWIRLLSAAGCALAGVCWERKEIKKSNDELDATQLARSNSKEISGAADGKNPESKAQNCKCAPQKALPYISRNKVN